MRTRISILILFAISCIAPSKAADDPLAKGFQNPPDSARPHTWWHWMDGNVTREGLTADLEAMKRAGIGGAQMFTVAVGIPKGPVGYMSDRWREMIAHAVREAGRLGIELCIHNCAGWSSSGGPWIKPENAMQVIAWSHINAHGPVQFEAILPAAKAPQVVQSIPFYKEIAVLAFRTPAEGDIATPARDILGKTGVVRQDGIQPDLTPGPAGLAIPKTGIIDITSSLKPDGRLVWNVPSGDWTILRLGYTPTGKDNHPAPPEGDGLEVDKLSREALDTHWAGMMARVIHDVGPLAGKVLNNSLIDSYEVGSQNWTPKMREEFHRLRGYDPLPFLPVIAGYTVESKQITERFLWDWRRTIADLFAENYYAYFGDLCHKAGMKFSTEPYGNGGFDNIQAGGKADIPMGEFWVGGAAMETTKLAASVGHVYGRPVIGAESFTADDIRGRYLVEPYGIKALGDLVFCNGINRYIFHRYAHQPWMNLKPGMTMGPWGTHLERTVTWWNDASAWLKYVARCQYLLQSGRFVADALYFYGDGAPADLPYRNGLNPRLPTGYDYDGCDANALMTASVVNGQVVLPSGMRYSVLILPDSPFMTTPVAKKVLQLVREGATVVGRIPEYSPSLTNYPACETEVREIGTQLTANQSLPVNRASYRVGKGTFIPLGDKSAPVSLQRVFANMRLNADFEATGGKLVYIHRLINGADAYFVSNQRYSAANVECSFRTSGRAPELWHADTGRIESAPLYRSESGRTVIPMRLDPAESVFVVFRRPASGTHLIAISHSGAPEPAEKNPSITIRKARYETPDGRGADVTEKVREMVAQGQYDIPATNDAYGDPVPLVVKQLRIEYELDGKPFTRTVGENETITLIEVSESTPGQAPFGLTVGADGSITLMPWTSGAYELKTSNGQTKRIVAAASKSFEVNGPWTVRFAPGWGAPESAAFDRLISWPDSAESGIRYFSGTATYVKEFDVPSAMLGSRRVAMLDLGRVKNFARVRLNGTDLGILWKAPFSVEVSKLLRSTDNRLEIAVTNLWPNRLIGDEQLPPDVEWNGPTLKKWPDWLIEGKPRPQTGRLTFTTWHFYNKDSPLLESGLLGPVVLRSTEKIVVK